MSPDGPRMPLQKILPRDNHAPQDIADLLVESHRVGVITGPGISTSVVFLTFDPKQPLQSHRQQSPTSTSFIDAVHSF